MHCLPASGAQPNLHPTPKRFLLAQQFREIEYRRMHRRHDELPGDAVPADRFALGVVQVDFVFSRVSAVRVTSASHKGVGR
jgi:hypothetical protein